MEEHQCVWFGKFASAGCQLVSRLSLPEFVQVFFGVGTERTFYRADGTYIMRCIRGRTGTHNKGSTYLILVRTSQFDSTISV